MISNRARLLSLAAVSLMLTDRDRPNRVAASQATPAATPVNGDLPTEQIAQLTGPPPSINNTASEWMVYGTDLGSSFLHKGEIVLVFGDTFGIDGGFWRSNVLGFSSDDDPADGVTIDRMITNQYGHAIELLPSKKVDFEEMTVIPTYGISFGERMFLHFMSDSKTLLVFG